MKHKNLTMLLAAWTIVVASGCIEREYPGEATTGMPIVVAADYRTTTRVTDAGFTDKDRMGIFITDYVDGVPQPIGLNGNRANNLLYTYREAENRWEGAATVYWKDDHTPVDVVGYYPFDDDLASVNRYEFSVQTRQETSATPAAKAGYEASDLLWTKNVQVAPTKETIRLLYHHLMAGVTVRLEEGTGFAAGEWTEAAKQVWIDNTIPQAIVDLEKGDVKTNGDETAAIVPLPYQGEYRAVVVPQTVASGKPLIGITVNGQDYKLNKSSEMVYTGGKMHTFTIKVDKRSESGDYLFTLSDEAVTAWVDDPDFHDGLIREYIVVHVETPGTFEQCLAERKLNVKTISSLKVTGKVNWADLEFMGDHLSALTYLNLHDVRIDDENDENDDVITGFHGHADQTLHPLTRVILPATLRGIGNQAFYRTSLSGSLEIPEGVTFIGYGAFIDCPFHAEIKLPSTLKHIEASAFQYSALEGEIRLPDGLEYIGGGAFGGLNLYGQLTLPNSLTDLGESAFAGCKLSGDLVLPQGITMWDRVFAGCQFTHVEIPEGTETIGEEMFYNVPLKGELLLPASLKTLKRACFRQTTITSVVLPKGLKQLEKEAFYGCNRLEGIITIPEKIIVIPEGTFMDCSLLDGVHLHKDVVFIAKDAFRNCYNMSTLVCDAVTPPVVEEGAFDGVPKDNFSIEVPAEAVSAYKMAEGWKEFKRITAYSNFVCRPATACAINTTHEETLTLNADGPWTVSHLPDWCEVTPASGNGKTSIRLRIHALGSGSEARKDSVVFTLTGTPFNTYCAVNQQNYEYAENELVALQKHTKGRGIDILFLGDGYDAEALASGKYLDLAREEMEYFFGLPPYDRFRDYFNVYAGIALSQETGINTVNTYRNTRFGTIYAGSKACNGPGPRLMPDDQLIFPYITQTLTDTPFKEGDLSRLLVILLPNTEEYGGVTYLYEDDRVIAICPRSSQAYPEDTRGVVQREAGGFGFGKLANERITYNLYAPTSVAAAITSGHGRGWYRNVSITGKMAEVPWAHFIFDPRYSDYVDVFEGGFDYTRKVWRSEASSCMNTGIPYYNTISRQAITERIKQLAGEPFDMEEFYENDTNEWGSTGGTTRTTVSGTGTGVNHAPIVVKGKYIPNRPKMKNK